MRAFAKLLSEIEQTNSTNEKVEVIAQFFKQVQYEPGAWALYFLSGQRPKKFVSSKKLREWAEELAGIPSWLGEECYAAVGDTAELISLVMGSVHQPDQALSEDLNLEVWIQQRLQPLKDLSEDQQKQKIQSWWKQLTPREIFVLNKLLTGGLRIGVSETLVYRALSQAFEIPRPVIAARLLGKWSPSAEFFKKVIRPQEALECGSSVDETEGEALPVPFCLAAPLESQPEDLGDIQLWQLEWKWDGIRAQIVKSGTKVELWSRGEERITESFADLKVAFEQLPGDFILDGEILAKKETINNGIKEKSFIYGSFNDLQKRINRKNPSQNFIRENPVTFVAYDFLRDETGQLTLLPLSERRSRLEKFVHNQNVDLCAISPIIDVKRWADAQALQLTARAHRAEGLMIKRLNAPYPTGRQRGIWFKWKVDPLTLDVVLTAAQPGSGRRASLYTDYTFAIWKGDTLVPIAKAYSGLTDLEINELDQWIRKNTVDRFGPVRTLKPVRVFEIGFEGVAESSRHKSGYAVRFPRILRERTDKPAAEADRVETVKQLLHSLESGAYG